MKITRKLFSYIECDEDTLLGKCGARATYHAITKIFKRINVDKYPHRCTQNGAATPSLMVKKKDFQADLKKEIEKNMAPPKKTYNNVKKYE